MSVTDVWVPGASAKVVGNALQSLTSAIVTQVVFGVDDDTTSNIITADQVNDRIVLASGVGTEGWYMFLGQIQFVANATGTRYAELRVAGSRIALSAAGAANIAHRQQIQGLHYHDGVASKAITLHAYQNSGVAVNIDSTADTFLQAVRITTPAA